MPAQGTVSPARAGARMKLVPALLIVGAAVPAAFLVGRTTYSRIVVLEAAPAGGRVAFVRDHACAVSGACQTLYVGVSPNQATEVARLSGDAEYCDEIAWAPDGTRVAFLVNGRQLRLYDAATLAPGGRVNLIPETATPARIARGITLSENGKAVTFDDCPRSHSGCRSGLAGLPAQ